VKSFNSL